MSGRRKPAPRTEPAHSFMYEPQNLPAAPHTTDSETLLGTVANALQNPFNQRQQQAFAKSFQQRLSLIWGPPGTGKTTVLAGIILGWLEHARLTDKPVRIGIGAANYNAIDKVLIETLDLYDYAGQTGHTLPTVKIARLRGDHSQPPSDDRIEDIPRNSALGKDIAQELDQPSSSIVLGGTWMQLGKLSEVTSGAGRPISQWFDLLIIDEASQVEVSAAGAYFLLLAEGAHVVLAGDHKQLGPIYGFEIRDQGEGLFDCIFSYMKLAHNVPHTALDQNYRNNNEIAEWPKIRFYPEGYFANFPQRRLSLRLPKNSAGAQPNWPVQLPWSDSYLSILDPDQPVVVITYGATSYTLSNPFEAQTVAALTYLYRHLLEQQEGALDDTFFWEQRLGIVTPHRAQIASIRNKLVEASDVFTAPRPIVDTVDRFQGLERDLIIASYTVADPDFVRSEDEFILSPRRFNVTLTRARSKFIMFISNAITQHLPSDIDVASEAAHLQLFVESYCSVIRELDLPFYDNGVLTHLPCRLRVPRSNETIS